MTSMLLMASSGGAAAARGCGEVDEPSTGLPILAAVGLDVPDAARIAATDVTAADGGGSSGAAVGSDVEPCIGCGMLATVLNIW